MSKLIRSLIFLLLVAVLPLASCHSPQSTTEPSAPHGVERLGPWLNTQSAADSTTTGASTTVCPPGDGGTQSDTTNACFKDPSPGG